MRRPRARFLGAVDQLDLGTHHLSEQWLEERIMGATQNESFHLSFT
jgi:hypothetical protein